MPQYNEVQYNASQYNVNLLTTTLTDLVNQTDSDQTESIDAVKQETINMVITLAKLLNNDPFLDDVMAMDATTVKEILIEKLETVSMADAITSFDIIKNVVDTMTPSDVRSMVTSILKLDSVFINDVVIKSITNKGLADTVRMAIWFKIKRTFSGVQFGDE